MKVWKVKFECGASAWFETYETLEVFLDSMIYTSQGEEREYWRNVDYKIVEIEEKRRIAWINLQKKDLM